MTNLYKLPMLGMLLVMMVSKVNKWTLWVMIMTMWSMVLEWMNQESQELKELFVLLTVMVMPCVMLSGMKQMTKNKKEFNVMQLLLLSLMLKYYTTTSMLWLYMTFEMSLVPLLVMLMMNQNNKKLTLKKLRSIKLLFMYTLIGSLLMLSGMLLWWSSVWNDSMMTNNKWLMEMKSVWMWNLMYLGLSMKLPMIPFHIWLFRAHAEAPIGLSMVLSSVVLKMATYGMIKLLLLTQQSTTEYMSNWVMMMLMMTIMWSSISALRQSDSKVLIAISSIGHQGMSMMGLFNTELLLNNNMNNEGQIGGLLLSLSHGFVSPGLFLLTGKMIYDRYHSRVIRYYRGMMKTQPMMMTGMLIYNLMNMGLPLSSNFISEYLTIISMLKWNWMFGWLASTTVFLVASSSMMLFTRMSFGKQNHLQYFSKDMNRLEYWLLMMLGIWICLIGILPNKFLSLMMNY